MAVPHLPDLKKRFFRRELLKLAASFHVCQAG